MSRCSCGGNTCSCVIKATPGSGVTVTGMGSPTRPYLVGLAAGASGNYVIKGQTGTFEVFVSPTGSDANDGLAVSRPFKTFQKAFDYLATQGPILQGQWYVTAAAGTYPMGLGQQTMTTRSVLPVIVRGPVRGHPNVPTAIIDGQGVATSPLVPTQQYKHGLSASGIGVQVEFRDLKFIRFHAGIGDTTRIGVLGEDNARVVFRNCHAHGASWTGAYAFACARSYVIGGIYEFSRSGFISNFGACTVNSGTIFRNNTESGVYWSRGTQGHVDNCFFTDNVRGLYISQSSRVDTIGDDFKRNTTAIMCDSGGVFGEGGAPNTFGSGADANSYDKEYRAFSGDTGELHAVGSGSETRLAYDRVTRTSTGTVAEVVLSTPFVIKAKRMAGGGKSCRVHVFGIWGSVTAGSVITVKFGGLSLAMATPAASASGVTFDLDVELFEVQGGFRASGRLLQGVGGVRLSNTATGFTVGLDQTIQVTVTAAATTDSITLYRTDVFITG